MKTKIYQILLIILFSSALSDIFCQTFTQGNIAVFVISSGANNSTGSIVELNPTTANQPAVNTYSINGTTAPNALRFSGSATSTGYLANSNDGTLLCFAGHNSSTTSGNANAILTRGVGTLNSNYTFNLSATYTGSSGNQSRCATSINNTTWFIADQGGLYTNNGTSGSPTGNFRGSKAFGGIVYLGQQSSSAIQVSTIAAPSGATLAGLPGLTNNNSFQDFYLIQSGSNGATYDVLYILSGTSATVGSIAKYSLVAGSWASNGTYATTFGGFGIAAQTSGTGALLFVSDGNGATSANKLIRLFDDSGYNTAINITTANNTILYTTASGTTIKGVAFAPTPCNPPVISSNTNNSPVCENGLLNLIVTTSGSVNGYAWSGPNSFTSTLQNPSIANVTLATTGDYTVTVTNNCGSVTSSVSVVVNPSPVVTQTASGSTTFCQGDSVMLTSSPENSYLWSTSETTQSIYVKTAGNFSVTVTNSNNCSATSNIISTTVNPVLTPSVSINASPGDTICGGTTVTFTAVPVNGGNAPSYHWKVNGMSSGTDSLAFTSNQLSDGDIVTCELVSNASCLSNTNALSNSIIIKVTSSVVPSVTISANPGTTICDGVNVTFSANATNGGDSPVFHWKLNGSIVGNNSDTFNINSLNDGDIISCELFSSNSCASPQNIISNELIIHVNPTVVPSVTLSAIPGDTICSGTNVIFTASVTNGGTPSYQWMRNEINVGTNSDSSSNAALNNGDTIKCIVTSSALCRTTDTVSAFSIMVVHQNPSPVITGSLVFCSGDSTTLDAGNGFTAYQWSNGETTQTITILTGGTFSISVFDGSCYGVSPSVLVNVLSRPSQPGNFSSGPATVYGGQTGVIYTIPNDTTVTYTWTYSGTGAIIHGTGNSVNINFSLSATNGILSVVSTNSCGTSVSRDISITITVLPGTMRITEFMYNGLGTGSVGEYVEFTNVGTTNVNMNGWSFDDNSRVAGSTSLSGFGIVKPGESVIFTELNAGAFRTNWNLCNGIKIVGNSNNNLGREDEINLYDSSGILVDRLTYGDQTYSPGSIRSNGKSGWVNSAGLGNNLITQWTLSSVGDAEGSYASAVNEVGSPGKSTRAIVPFDPCLIINGAPTIIMNVSTTTNYLDGAVTTSPASPYGLSGVINDSLDPAAIYGVDFTIGDPESAADSLTVTATSNNQSVVADSNLIVTGSGSSRKIKIIPTGVGYATITIAVNDDSLTTNYIIDYAASDPAPTLMNTKTFWHTGMSDASAAIPIDNNFYIAGDDELDILNVYSRANSGLPFVSYNYTSNLALPDPGSPEVDVEGGVKSITHANRIYWTGSMSNGKLPYDNKPNRDRLFAVDATGTSETTSFAFVGYSNIRTALLAWGDSAGYNFTASATAGVNPKGISGFSLEGMTFGPDNTTLYLGLRAPLVPTTFRHKAVIAPLLNFESWFNNGMPIGNPTFGTPIELDLDFRGIRDIVRLSNGTYIIIAGSPIDDGGINNIYKWSGDPSDAPVGIVNDAGGLLNLESLMQVNDSSGQMVNDKLQFISDNGANILYQDASEAKDFADLKLRKFRSDLVSGLDLNLCAGLASSIIPSGNTTICNGDSVMMTAPAGSNYVYQWSTGETTQSIYASAFQNYSVTISSNAGICSSTSPVVTLVNSLPSDFNNDHLTNTVDFLQLVGVFDHSCTCVEDLDHNGAINNDDFLILLSQFNHTCH